MMLQMLTFEHLSDSASNRLLKTGYIPPFNIHIPTKVLFPISKSERKAEGSIFNPASSSCGSE